MLTEKQYSLISFLNRYKDLISVRELCKESGVSYSTVKKFQCGIWKDGEIVHQLNDKTCDKILDWLTDFGETLLNERYKYETDRTYPKSGDKSDVLKKMCRQNFGTDR